ncbi:MAG: molybdopterin-dependent oxidoreductase, partial [Acidimicrobiia bacterium]|nr:molybdopterin-dependent oxidoreductase [Acidimicrobiia bacterium]
YTCEKALRINHYQNGRHRLTHPLRRTPDGDYERIDWDTAIREVAAGFARVRDTHGGETIFYYGGGGQGNHLGGGYSGGTRAALGSRFASNALAQEKTGEFWVDGELFGSSTCHTTGDYEHADVAVFWGKNPWQSHGFPRARVVLKEIANDPGRTLVVIDPKVSESADLADIHLRPKPGGDGFLLTALLAALFDEGLIDGDFVAERTVGIDEVERVMAGVDIADYSNRAGVTEAEVRALARVIGQADSVSIFEDLGIQMAPHSTMNSYLEKLVVLLTGNFGRRGGMNLHTYIIPLWGRHDDRTTPVTGHRLVTGLVPCNIIPDEIATDHPDRFRALLVESGNPAHSLADSARWREAFEALEFSVVIDVAMTETARLADYVLPAASQYEKWETTFFTMEFPENSAHLRRPLFEPLGETLPEPEIHARLCRELEALIHEDIAPLREVAATGDRAAFANALFTAVAEKPELNGQLPVLLYETLGATFDDGGAPAAMWGLAQRTAAAFPQSVQRAGHADGDALFDAMHAGQGVIFSVDDYDVTFDRIVHGDGKIHLAIPDLLNEVEGLVDESLDRDEQWPFILAAGERRSSTANTIFRDPDWRKKDRMGALRVHPDDAAAVGLTDGGEARVITASGQAVAPVELHDGMQPGFISLPNGFGLDHPGGDSDSLPVGVAPNELTSSADRDWFAGTPHHKHVPARLEPVA